ncbi:acyl carrier protein [Streptomyces netropsis]|uniref:acyl carrier protein n=1 Tax=Streptomyces netropsis TaxID=55404 RepID=UPI0021AAE29E|nr:acyl carrier protein [Streptomyces netropsis]
MATATPAGVDGHRSPKRASRERKGNQSSAHIPFGGSVADDSTFRNTVTSTVSTDVAPSAEPPAAAVARTVRRIWADVLEVDIASIDLHHSDFFELGGYSLLALQSIGRLLAEYGVDEVASVELEGALLNRLFEDATPMAQAECLVAGGHGGAAPGGDAGP